MKKVTILIPCYNEEKAIGKVIDTIPYERLRKLGFIAEVIVIDNNSSDATAEIALERNVVVISENKKGKGNAMKAGFSAISSDTDYVVMLDGDNTYSPDEIPRIIEPLESNFCDVVIGSRLSGKIRKGSFKFSNRVANWFYTFLTRQIYRANTTDVLSGYFGWKKEVIDEIKDSIKAGGFVLEIEMIIKMVRSGYEIYAVPITYNPREGKSKLHPVRDGLKILHSLVINIFWSGKKKESSQVIALGNQNQNL